MDYTVYAGSISSTPLQYARDMIDADGFFPHYVFFRGGDYDYYLITGDVQYSNSFFVFTDARIYHFNYSHSSIQSFYVLESFSGSGSVGNPGNAVVYSDRSGFPRLTNREGVYLFAAFFFSFVVFCVALWFSYLFRIVTRR